MLGFFATFSHSGSNTSLWPSFVSRVLTLANVEMDPVIVRQLEAKKMGTLLPGDIKQFELKLRPTNLMDLAEALSML